VRNGDTEKRRMGEKIRSYKDLRVYQLALDKAMEIFEITKTFPAEERYSLIDQARRSSRSVCTNIAEAWRKRRYKNAFIAKLSDAETEACETQVWLEFAFRCNYISKTTAESLDAAYNKIIGQIVKMIDEADKWLIRPKVPDSPIHRFSDSKKVGFTFIELVIVIILIGILTAAIGPRILHLQDGFKVEAAAEQIANHIRLAQSRAIARHETHGIDFDTGGNLYSVYDENGAAIKNPLKRDKDLIIDFDTDEQLKNITLSGSDFGGKSYVTFNALGKPTNGGSVTITKGSSTLHIGVATETGAVSIW